MLMESIVMFGLAMVSMPAIAEESEDEGTPSGYVNVNLVDDGPTKMDDKREYRSIVIPGFSFIPPGIKGRYQFLVTDHVSVMGGAGISTLSSDNSETAWRRWHGLVGVDYHPIGNGFHGFYVGGRALYRHGNTSFGFFDEDVETETVVTIFRGLLGYRVVIDPGISIGMGVGPAYRILSRDTAGTTSGYKTTIPALEFNLGWAF